MKKHYLFLSILIGLFSCSGDDFMTGESTVQIEEDISLKAANTKYRTLGFSYDITGELLDKKSIRRVVIDIEKLEAATKHVIIYNDETGGDHDYYYGYTSYDYIKEVNSVSGFSGSVAAGPLKDEKKLFGIENLLGFGGNISYNKEFQTKYTYSSKYSFASYDLKKYVASIYLADNVQNLSKYLSDKFISDLNAAIGNEAREDQFIKDYGTHILTDITVGGILRFIYRSSIVEESDYTRKKDIIKSGLNVTLKNINVTANYDSESQIQETLTNKNKESRLYIKYKAGTGVDTSYDLETGTPRISTTSWENSVNINNSGLVEVNWDRTYPIYEFILDPTKKARIKAAVQRYIAKNQLEVLELKPLYRTFNDGINDTNYVFDWNTVVKGGLKGYRCVDGYILAKPIANSKPMYKMFSYGNKDTFYLFDWKEVSTSKDRYDGIVGYVLKTQEKDTKPMYRMFNHQIRDTHYVFDVYTASNNYERIDGYVFK